MSCIGQEFQINQRFRFIHFDTLFFGKNYLVECSTENIEAMKGRATPSVARSELRFLGKKFGAVESGWQVELTLKTLPPRPSNFWALLHFRSGKSFFQPRKREPPNAFVNILTTNPITTRSKQHFSPELTFIFEEKKSSAALSAERDFQFALIASFSAR